MQHKKKKDLHDSIAEIRWSAESLIVDSTNLLESHGNSAGSDVTLPSHIGLTSPFRSGPNPSIGKDQVRVDLDLDKFLNHASTR